MDSQKVYVKAINSFKNKTELKIDSLAYCFSGLLLTAI